jgi:exodeoxyribonuclease III
MKISTFNINNINRRLDNLLAWMKAAKPDVVCLQELKAHNDQFPLQAIENAGYGAVWRGQSRWNGVAILARDAQPILTRTALPDDPDPSQSRYIEAAVNGILIASLYAPNGNPQPGPKYHYKIEWTQRLNAHAAELLAANVPVVLAGDYNVVPEPRDIYPTRSYDDNALIQPAIRALYADLLGQGWTDALRADRPDEDALYTFWGYMRKRWPRNAGLRLDHLLVSPSLADKITGTGIDKSVRGEIDASDHAPVWLELNH